ncbi:hypothetical protein KHA80_21020 [Anaerobacillus sp. HL2]|nr:hypothetical protein KHA80_21020 [Anaerobacillus sp. HL2]
MNKFKVSLKQASNKITLHRKYTYSYRKISYLRFGHMRTEVDICGTDEISETKILISTNIINELKLLNPR